MVTVAYIKHLDFKNINYNITVILLKKEFEWTKNTTITYNIFHTLHITRRFIPRYFRVKKNELLRKINSADKRIGKWVSTIKQLNYFYLRTQ